MKGTNFSQTLTVILAVALAGCSGDAGDSDRRLAANSNITNRAAASNAAEPNQQAGPSNNGVTPAAADSAENSLMAAKRDKIETMRRSGVNQSAKMADVETLLRQSTRPAPEDSEFAIALTNVVVERRTFPKHPVLARVEKVTDGQRSTIKLSMKDGRIIELPGSAIEKLSVAPSVLILSAAGIGAPLQRSSKPKPGRSNSN